MEFKVLNRVATKKFSKTLYSCILHRHGIKKSLCTRFWGTSRAAFRVRKIFCVRDSRRVEKSRRVRKIAYAKSRTQNRVAYTNRVRKSRT